MAARAGGATTRRAFLQGAGLAAGALVVGFTLPLQRPRAATAPAGEAAAGINAWLRIDADGTATVIVSKSEMGQGIYTGYAQVVAEELDLDWRRVRVESAPVAPVYNVPFAPIQFTGGSLSIATGYESLRAAGATARARLVAAAAEELGVDAASLATADGAVVHAASGRRLDYGALAARAAALPQPEGVQPKPRSAWKYVGQPLPRLDSREKSDGSASFGLDVRVPGLHFAVLARAPVHGASVRRFDPAPARAVPGVVGVYPVPQGVAVVATNTWAARRGRDLLQVEWNDGPGAAYTSAEVAERFARLAREPGHTVKRTGDPAQAAAGAARVLEADYAGPLLAHAALEPLNCAVAIGPDGADVWTGTQMQTTDRAAAARVLGLPPERVRLHTTLLGGGFGRRANPVADFVVDACAVAKAAGRPVLTVWTREDDMRGFWYRPQGHARLTAALGADGRPVAWTHTQVVQPLLRGTPFAAMVPPGGVEPTSHEGASDLPYAVPNLHVDVHEVELPLPVLWWRSVGHTHTAFAVESFVDECAQAAGQDPLAYRLALLRANPGHERHVAALELAAAKAGWGRPLPAGRARGIAVHASFGSVVAEVAEVSLADGRPRVHRIVCAIHCGTAVNPRLVEHQLESAVTLGLSAALQEEITVEAGRVQQANFGDYPPLRFAEMPRVEAHIVPSDAAPTGVGEPGLPPVAPALANALYALTGVRARRLPLAGIDFTRRAG